MAAKRSRTEWEDCQDLDELKQHMAGLQARVDKLSKENASLKKVVKTSEAAEPDESPEALAAHAKKMRAAIQRQIEGAMIYKNKHNTSRVSAEFPNVSLAQAKAIMGDSLVAAAKSGPKKMEATATSEQLSDMFGYKAFCKSLRYGANLTLENGLKYSFAKEDGTLKITGSYSMAK